VLNVFLLVLGMIMDGFSAILVAVPLVLPFAARFHLAPFHLAVMFLLNLELAFMLPPLGLNLFIASFRFNRPVASLYRVVLPFAAIVTVALAVITYVPQLSVALILPDIAAARAAARATSSPPTEAWQLECVQEDSTHPLPCTAEEAALYRTGEGKSPSSQEGEPGGAPEVENVDDELMRQMMGEGADAGARGATTEEETGEDDDMFRQMLGAGADAAP
jgi:hypothetical protein